ncbi:VOC family protein [Flavihumibacter sp. CACIAM 22H1]|uniref:VOC family protein n=1 Tax=Flavihumibacter sp. CACIAM 22H1 TaxID=1812911 RepID=UPI0007A7C4FB|nr:VOC family protein [Flavihumibacter sp. CACIAM 22H1]KYP13751.1 MAG: glyoxalase [Flavihumibacter sp. CACIAM 22H1]
MLTTNTYLNFKNNCEAAFRFYQSVFGGEFIHVGRFGDMPESEEFKVPEADKNKIMHISLPIGQSVLMGSDCGSAWEAGFIQGNNFSISIHTDSKEEADQHFARLSAGGSVTMPMNQTFWGSYFGMLTDPFGVNWMISFEQHPPLN